MDSLRRALAAELEKIDDSGLRRCSREIEPCAVTRVNAGGRRLVMFGSNDYLGLARDPRLTRAAAQAAEEWGTGSTGSRLTTGTYPAHRQLEREIAELKGAEAALFFSSGYLASVGTIPALVGRGDLIVSDALNHASLIDGCRLSRAEVRVFRHADAAHAAELLADRARFRRALVATDGVFSMDGDLAPLPALTDLCEATDAWLMVDDAHGTGVLGPSGGGTVEQFGLTGRVAVQMGTASKALGVEGGFIAGPVELIGYLENRARSFVFSTAPPPASLAAIRAALAIVRSEPERREALWRNVHRLRDGLSRGGLDVSEGGSAIVPVLIGEAEAAVRASRRLEEEGFWIPAIRPPTVPPGTSRLRLCVSARHTPEQIDAAAQAVLRVLGKES
jgi:8-amino-7-oxononanoate synthase